MSRWTYALIGILGGLLLCWLILVAVLWLTRPEDRRLRELLRLLPDVVRLLRRLAGDAELPRGVRIRLWLLLGYLALPIDLVPDFIPVLGYADDVIVVAIAVRHAVAHAGDAAIERHWPGTPEGLAALPRIVSPRTP